MNNLYEIDKWIDNAIVYKKYKYLCNKHLHTRHYFSQTEYVIENNKLFNFNGELLGEFQDNKYGEFSFVENELMKKYKFIREKYYFYNIRDITITDNKVYFKNGDYLGEIKNNGDNGYLLIESGEMEKNKRGGLLTELSFNAEEEELIPQNDIKKNGVRKSKMEYLNERYPDYKGTLMIYENRVFREIKDFIEIIGVFDYTDNGSFEFYETHEREDEHAEKPLKKYANSGIEDSRTIKKPDTEDKQRKIKKPIYNRVTYINDELELVVEPEILNELSIICGLKCILRMGTYVSVKNLLARYDDFDIDYILNLIEKGYLTYQFDYIKFAKNELKYLYDSLGIIREPGKRTKEGLWKEISLEKDDKILLNYIINLNSSVIRIELSPKGIDYYDKNVMITSGWLDSEFKSSVIKIHRIGESYHDTMSRFLMSKTFLSQNPLYCMNEILKVAKAIYHRNAWYYHEDTMHLYYNTLILHLYLSINGFCGCNALFVLKKMILNGKWSKEKIHKQVDKVFKLKMYSYIYNPSISIMKKIKSKKNQKYYDDKFVENLAAIDIPYNLCPFEILKEILADIKLNGGVSDKWDAIIFEKFSKSIDELSSFWFTECNGPHAKTTLKKVESLPASVTAVSSHAKSTFKKVESVITQYNTMLENMKKLGKG